MYGHWRRGTFGVLQGVLEVSKHDTYTHTQRLNTCAYLASHDPGGRSAMMILFGSLIYRSRRIIVISRDNYCVTSWTTAMIKVSSTHRGADRQRETDRQSIRQTDRRKDGQIDGHTETIRRQELYIISPRQHVSRSNAISKHLPHLSRFPIYAYDRAPCSCLKTRRITSYVLEGWLCCPGAALFTYPSGPRSFSLPPFAPSPS